MILHSKEKQLLFHDEIIKIEQKYSSRLNEPLVNYYHLYEDHVAFIKDKNLNSDIQIAIVAVFNKLNV